MPATKPLFADPNEAVEAFASFAAAVCGLELEPFQRRIARELFDPAVAEVVITVARGQGKTALMAAFALFHLVTTRDPSAFCVAASREQAAILWRFAGTWAMHPSVQKLVNVRHLELRRRVEGLKDTSALGGGLRVLASDATKLHGLSFSLAICDELAQHKNDEVYVAMRSALHKRPAAKLVTISTAGAGVGSPLGKLRARALAQPHVERDEGFTYARGGSFALLDWSLPEDGNPDDAEQVKRCAAPASWISEEAIAEQRAALPDSAFRRYVANQWVAKLGAWLPAAAWQKCVGLPTFTDGERIWVGVDVGGERSASAVVWINEAGHVGAAIYHGDEGVLDCIEQVRDLAAAYRVQEVAFDPWRFGQAAQELERERLLMVAFPQTDARMIPASQRLYDAIIDRHLVLPDDPLLARHAADAIGRHSRRGWRLDKASRADNIDAVVALAIALDRRDHRPEPARLLGFV